MDIKENFILVRRKREKISFIVTICIWIIVFIMGNIIPFVPVKKHYNTVQIHLDITAPVEKKQIAMESVQKNEDAVKHVEKNETETIQKTIQEIKTQPKKTSVIEKQVGPKQTLKTIKTVSKKKRVSKVQSHSSEKKTLSSVKPKLVKSVDELISEQSSASSSDTQWNESAFENSSEKVTQTKSTVQDSKSNESIENALQGSAAHVAKTNSAFISSNTNKKSYDAKNSSASTQSALGKIKAATYTQHSEGITSTSSINSKETKNGSTVIQMSDGSERMLLDPKKPNISISKENASLIDSSRSITIYFTVLAEGNVPLSKIEIKPASSLPVVIQSEIKTQISEWRFATDSSDGIVKFSLTIKKE